MTRLLAPFACLLLALPSCALAIGAALGAGAVHTSSEDSAQLLTRSNAEDTFAACESTLERLGAVDSADPKRLVIDGSVSESRLTVQIVPSGRDRHRVTVSARRLSGLSPDLETARRVAGEIAELLE
jgi:hypothetical protein